jgi:cell division protease FtsH
MPSRNTILAKRNRWYRRLFRFLRAFWPLTLLGTLALVAVVLSYVSNDALNAYLVGVATTFQFLLQLVFAIAFAIIQFVAIFWFMARSKTEVIVPGDPKSLTLADYKGQKQLVKLVKEWISLLSDRTEFQKMGGNYINGLLLYGPPGTGKTMLAKCMAGEAGIAFISMEGSGFRAMFWGVDVLKMIRFCGQAKKMAREYGACIAYIDEIDAVGASRGNVMGGGMMGMMGGGSGSLTRLLYEMDGIGELTRWEKFQGRIYKMLGKKPPVRNWHVLYMGSTNRPDVLDPALTRPGRFDRSIEVNVPDKTGRREIIEYYLGKIKHDETVNVEAIVADTQGDTPARIMSALTKDAVRIALFAGRQAVSQRDIDLAFQEQYFGIERPIEEMEDDQRRVLAYHEAGHVIVQHYLMPDQRIVRASIIRRGGAYGYMLPVDTKEWHIVPLRRHVLDIMVSLAGRASEKVFFGEPFQSVGGDYANVRGRIWVLYMSGMFGPPISGQAMLSSNMPGGEHRAQGEKDRIIEQYWRVLEDQTEKLLRVHAAEVHAIANALIERSDLNSSEVLEIMELARTEAAARGEPVPEGLPQMTIQLLPEYQKQPARLEELEPAPSTSSPQPAEETIARSTAQPPLPPMPEPPTQPTQG